MYIRKEKQRKSRIVPHKDGEDGDGEEHSAYVGSFDAPDGGWPGAGVIGVCVHGNHGENFTAALPGEV